MNVLAEVPDVIPKDDRVTFMWIVPPKDPCGFSLRKVKVLRHAPFFDPDGGKS